jgi:hypothetical protein
VALVRSLGRLAVLVVIFSIGHFEDPLHKSLFRVEYPASGAVTGAFSSCLYPFSVSSGEALKAFLYDFRSNDIIVCFNFEDKIVRRRSILVFPSSDFRRKNARVAQGG